MTLAELRKVVRSNITGSGHYAGCELVHGWCAAERAFVELAKVEAELIELRLRVANKRGGASLKLKLPRKS